jgi:autotransporter adhesin
VPTYSIQGSSYYNVGDAFSAFDGYVTSLNGYVATLTSRVSTLESTPGLGLPVGSGGGLALGEGSLAADATDTAFGAGATVGADSGTAVGSGATIAPVATNSVAVGANSSVTATSGTALGESASVTATGAVAIGQGSVANQANTVSVGSVGSERRVTNVAAGTAPTDAANVGQVQASATQTLSSANAYTDNRFTTLNEQYSLLATDLDAHLSLQDERIDRNGAMSSAMMSMAINAAGGNSENGRMAVGAGWQNGESALSIGYKKDVGKASFSLGGAFSSDDQSVGVGFGFDL